MIIGFDNPTNDPAAEYAQQHGAILHTIHSWIAPNEGKLGVAIPCQKYYLASPMQHGLAEKPLTPAFDTMGELRKHCELELGIDNDQSHAKQTTASLSL